MDRSWTATEPRICLIRLITFFPTLRFFKKSRKTNNFLGGRILAGIRPMSKWIFARSAFTFVVAQSEFPSVRLSVRKFWDFCEGDMEVSRIELSTGTLKHGFLGVPKKDARKVALRVTIRTFRDPILDHFFWTFLFFFVKKWFLLSHTHFNWYPESHLFEARQSTYLEMNYSPNCASRPCRARCI